MQQLTEKPLKTSHTISYISVIGQSSYSTSLNYDLGGILNIIY